MLFTMNNDEYKENLLTTITTLGNELDLAAFFKELLSESEISDIVSRWAIFNEVRQCTPQRKIAEKYQISLAKVNKFGKVLQLENGFIRKMLDRKYDETSL